MFPIASLSERKLNSIVIITIIFCCRWRASRQESLASAAGTCESPCTDGRSGSSHVLTWTRLASSMFPHRDHDGQRERARRSTVTRARGLNSAVLLLALVTLMGKWIASGRRESMNAVNFTRDAELSHEKVSRKKFLPRFVSTVRMSLGCRRVRRRVALGTSRWTRPDPERTLRLLRGRGHSSNS